MSKYRVFYLLDDNEVKHQKIEAESIKDAEERFLLNNIELDIEIIGVEGF